MPIEIEKIDTTVKGQVKLFTRFPFKLYEKCPQWVPPILADVETMLNRNKHPFYEHSDADFFIARWNDEIVGRVAVIENRPFNRHHHTHHASFYFFDSIEEQQVANALFERVFDWAKGRGLDHIVGPKGLSAFDGYGVQIEGFEHRQMMTMMNYNHAYYPGLYENLGFKKEVDFVSCYVKAPSFHLDPRIHEISRRLQERGTFKIINFKNRKHLMSWAYRIGEAYNKAFINNWEYYPLTQKEIQFVVDNVIAFADPKLLKIIVSAKDEVVGFAFGFPDVSAALQRQRGSIGLSNPIGIVDLLIEMKRTKWVSMNGIGVLPELQGRGGVAVLYSEMEKSLANYHFDHMELTQVAETATQMRKELVNNLGGSAYKNHRIYQRVI